MPDPTLIPRQIQALEETLAALKFAQSATTNIHITSYHCSGQGEPIYSRGVHVGTAVSSQRVELEFSGDPAETCRVADYLAINGRWFIAGPDGFAPPAIKPH